MNKLTEPLTEKSYDVLATLRDCTKARHELLDSRLPISAGAPTLAAYRQHLRALRAWLAPIHAWLDGFNDGPQATGFLPATERIAMIDLDLAEPCLAEPFLAADDRLTDQPTDQPAHLSAPSSPALPPAAPAGVRDDAAYRWGVCYVIEGSQLGGAVLYRRLRETLNPHPLRYLRAGDAGPGPRWTAFINGLRLAVREPAAIASACAGAGDAFDRILAIHGLGPELADLSELTT